MNVTSDKGAILDPHSTGDLYEILSLNKNGKIQEIRSNRSDQWSFLEIRDENVSW